MSRAATHLTKELFISSVFPTTHITTTFAANIIRHVIAMFATYLLGPFGQFW